MHRRMMRASGTRPGTVVLVDLGRSGCSSPLVACLAAAAGSAVALRPGPAAAHRATLEERGWLLERERESAAQTAVDAERARIARELHDIVSHNVSVMVIQAGAAGMCWRPSPTRPRRRCSPSRAAGRDTMAELRHLLGLLAPVGQWGGRATSDWPRSRV